MSISLDKVVSLNPQMLFQLHDDMVNEESFTSTNWTVLFQTDGVQQLIFQKHMFVINILVSEMGSLHHQSCVGSNNFGITLWDTTTVIYSLGALLTLLSKIDGAQCLY